MDGLIAYTPSQLHLPLQPCMQHSFHFALSNLTKMALGLNCKCTSAMFGKLAILLSTRGSIQYPHQRQCHPPKSGFLFPLRVHGNCAQLVFHSLQILALSLRLGMAMAMPSTSIHIPNQMGRAGRFQLLLVHARTILCVLSILTCGGQ